MEKLVVCRVCLSGNVQCILGKQLQEVYEKFISAPTQVIRPVTVCYMCYMCYAKLNKSYKLMQQCLRADSILTLMLNQMDGEDQMENKTILLDKLSLDSPQLTMSGTECIDLGHEPETADIATDEARQELAVKTELLDMCMDTSGAPVEKKPTPVIENDCKKETRCLIIADAREAEASVSKVRNDNIMPDINDKNSPDSGSNINEICNDSIKSNITIVSNDALKDGLNNKELVNLQSKLESIKNTDSSSIKNKTKIKFSVKANIRVPTDSKHACDVCKRRFNRKGNLERHIRMHSAKGEECNYPCNVCQKSFKYQSNLKTHIRIHTGERPFTCEICQKSFIQQSDLKIHTRIHTGEKPYSCNVCQKSFNVKTHLSKHIRIHTGERPFFCSLCYKCFNQNGHLSRHMASCPNVK